MEHFRPPTAGPPSPAFPLGDVCFTHFAGLGFGVAEAISVPILTAYPSPNREGYCIPLKFSSVGRKFLGGKAKSPSRKSGRFVGRFSSKKGFLPTTSPVRWDYVVGVVVSSTFPNCKDPVISSFAFLNLSVKISVIPFLYQYSLIGIYLFLSLSRISFQQYV